MTEHNHLFRIPPSLVSFVMDEAVRLKTEFGLKSLGDIMQVEEDFWKRTALHNPETMLKLYQQERERSHILTELIWAVVKKAGGEIRLGSHDLAPFDWQLLETYDAIKCEKVFKADVLTPGKTE